MAADKTTESEDEQTGTSSVADEAAKLAQAFSLWAQTGRGATTDRTDGSAPDADGATACGCGHGDSVEAVCRMCPVCRVAGMLQAVQPDLLDRVADLLSVVAGGLHSAAEERRAQGTAGTTGDDID